MAGGLSLCPDVKRAARPAGSVFLGSTRVLLRDPLRSPRAQHPLRPISRAGSPLRPGRTGSTVRQRAIFWGFRSAAIPGQRELGRPPPGPPARNLNTVKRVGQPDGERRLEQPAARPAVSPVFFFPGRHTGRRIGHRAERWANPRHSKILGDSEDALYIFILVYFLFCLQEQKDRDCTPEISSLQLSHF